MTNHVSPLRYPGGKARLSPYIKLLLTKNHLHDAHYVEPYAGGASVALSLLLSEHIEHAHINDIDPGIHAFWHSVLFRTDDLCERVTKTPLTIPEWRRQRAVHSRGRRAARLDLGFATLFLNRTNRSGIINSGGPIGGICQRGYWKLSARFGREGLVDRIQAIGAYRDRISLHNRDAAELLSELFPVLPRRSFAYLDPPYYVKGQRRLYLNGYGHDDHVRLAAVISRQRRWMISYDDVPAVRKLYRGHRSIKYRLAYTAGVRLTGSEVAFFSPDLSIPRARAAIRLSFSASRSSRPARRP